jgi:hypothetical protein
MWHMRQLKAQFRIGMKLFFGLFPKFVQIVSSTAAIGCLNEGVE